MAKRSCSYGFTYDVFLNFRGSDTRYGFTGNLYKALCDRGIHTFFDDKELQSGEEITPSLLDAIEESRIAITVLSKHYASSSFCLDELAAILDCSESKGTLVIPVFYKVDPSKVRRQKGLFREALAKHEERFPQNMEKVQKWKMALHQVANFSGYHFKHGDEYEYNLIGRIVELVSSKISRAPLHVADHPVALESQVLKVRKLLDVEFDDGVHMVGIHGISGIGKSTLARAVYNSIADNFEGLCFLDNVKENSTKHGMTYHQETLLSEIVGDNNIKLGSVSKGISIIKQRLQRKKVLVILDDVDKHEQLQAIVGKPDWFGPGSRVIITTRDKQLLASHEVKRIYELKELNNNDSLQLLTWKAFKTQQVDPTYVEVLNDVVTYASGLPLALEIIGSDLFGKGIEEWKSAINHYKRIPNTQILEKLKVSFDSLGEEEKSIFLDIACCYKGYELKEVEDIFRAHYGDCLKNHIDVLVKKCLIKHWNRRVTLHNLIEDMGKEIVRQESPKEPGRRSRLWLPQDILQLFKENTGTSKTEIIFLDFPVHEEEEIVEWNGNSFKEMKNLRTLIIRNGNFSNGPKYLPNSLRVLDWWRYPSDCLPYDFHPKELSICKLPFSCLTSFELDDLFKKFVNLKVLNFDWCDCLTQIPDVSSLLNLEKLSFKYCQELVTVHHSIGFLDKLKILNAEGCNKLGSFPPIKLTSLEQLNLSHCGSLNRFPEIVGKMENIRNLQLKRTPIKEFPFSFQNLIQLQGLNVEDCPVVQFPSSLVRIPQLTTIIIAKLKGWQWLKPEDGDEKIGSIVSSKVQWLCITESNLRDDFFSIDFMWFANVKILNLAHNNFTILPDCMKELQFIKELDVSYCKNLQEIRGIPPKLRHFSAVHCNSLTSSSISTILNQELHEAAKTVYMLPGDRIPEWFGHQSREPSISFWFRNKFPAKVLCHVIEPKYSSSPDFTPPMVFINRKVRKCSLGGLRAWSELNMAHTILFDLQNLMFRHNPYEMPLENEWNHVEFRSANGKQTLTIHVFEQECSLEDIRFTHPLNEECKRVKLHAE